MTRTLATSPDGQWAVARDGRELLLFAGAGGAPVAKLGLDTEDVDVSLVGPPTSLVLVARDAARTQVTLYAPPTFELAAKLDVEVSARVAAVTGPRLALVSADAKQLIVVRSAGRALASQKLEVTGPLEFVVGLERNQLLLSLMKKIEVWDAVSGRPLLRPQFQFPPPPRVLGTAAGHVWAMRQNGDEIFVYRLSDGRPFRHYAGSQIREVICHPASPVIVLVTERGLVRLHCFAHSLQVVDNVPDPPGALAQVVVGEEVSLLGYLDEHTPPWRIPLTGAAPVTTTSEALAATATGAPAVAGGATRVETTRATNRTWREPLVAFATEVAKGDDVDMPTLGVDTELGELVHRLSLSPAARRALIVLYALHLIGEPSLPIAKLAKIVEDWPEALGQGDLGALALVRKKHGKVALRRSVTNYLDGVGPRHVRLAGGNPTAPRAGAFRVSREGRTDAEIETELVGLLGRIAIVAGSLPAALLEARLHGATAVTTTLPAERPLPWPRDAGLVLVLYGTASSWVADVPTLPAPATTAS